MPSVQNTGFIDQAEGNIQSQWWCRHSYNPGQGPLKEVTALCEYLRLSLKDKSAYAKGSSNGMGPSGSRCKSSDSSDIPPRPGSIPDVLQISLQHRSDSAMGQGDSLPRLGYCCYSSLQQMLIKHLLCSMHCIRRYKRQKDEPSTNSNISSL